MSQVLPSWSVEEWTKIITASVALVAVIVGPILQWRIARRQVAGGRRKGLFDRKSQLPD
jgi:hypothetical protein